MLNSINLTFDYFRTMGLTNWTLNRFFFNKISFFFKSTLFVIIVIRRVGKTFFDLINIVRQFCIHNDLYTGIAIYINILYLENSALAVCRLVGIEP